MPASEPQSSQARQGRIRLKTRASHGWRGVDTDRGDPSEALEVPGPYLWWREGPDFSCLERKLAYGKLFP